ncbi:hypothetical protein [Streptomyces sp. NBC_01198]|uniref:hypothetical protein n=1 Tax=Streptomyces sp. NBC_01198 TaxID=2903769 RepID=UPI002E10D5EB|nr:hypothetical protein OG702_33845 [Streptomyces sp. NBC_01198]
MNMITKRASGALAAGAVAALIGLTGAPSAHAAAGPNVVARPFSSSHCGAKWCVSVVGSGLHVDYETVSEINNGAMVGYVTAQDDDDSWHKASAWVAASSGSEKLTVNRSFSNNSSFCGGISSSSSWTDYKDMVCFTIHS